MVNARGSLAQLLQQIADLVTSGEDSGSQHSDGSVPVRLRSVVLALLDQVVAPGATVRPRDVGSILRLVNLALKRVPSMFGGDNRCVLSEVLARVIPMLSRPALAEVREELVQTHAKILAILADSNPALWAAVVRGFVEVFTDAFGTAMVLGVHPEMSATLACFAGVLGETDSAGAAALQLPLESGAACELLLGSALSILAAAAAPRPLAALPLLPAPALRRACALLAGSSVELQAGAMQLLRAVLLATPHPPLPPLDVLDAMRQMLQQVPVQSCVRGSLSGQSLEGASGRDEAQRAAAQHWWEQLLGLLHAMLDASARSPARGPILAAVAGAALHAAEVAAGTPGAQQQLCQLYREAVAQHPQMLEHQAPQLLQLLRSLHGGSGSGARDELCHSLVLYLGQHSAEHVQQAFAAAANSSTPAEEEEEMALASARKRRRLRLTPQRLPVAAGSASPGSHSSLPAALQAVAAAVWRAASAAQELQARAEGQLPAAPTDPAEHGSASCRAATFLALLRVMAAAGSAPSLLLQLCTPLVPAWLDAGRGSVSESQPLERLLVASEGLLVATTTALEASADGGVPAAASLAAVQPAALQQLLERGWEAVRGWEAPDAAAKARAVALVLSLALVATQADLLEGAETLQQLFSAAYGTLTAGSPPGGGAAPPLQRVLGLLLPPACVVAVAKEDAHSSSQPRATQAGGGRRHHLSQHAGRQGPNPLANPLVAILQTQLCSLGEGMAGETSGGTGAAGAGGEDPAQQQQLQRGQAQLTAGTARGLLAVLQLAHQPHHLVQIAVGLALCEGGGSYWPHRRLGSSEPEGQPTLATAVVEWVRPALEQLCTCSDHLVAPTQVDVLRAVGAFLLHAAPGQLEHSQALAAWALQACSSRHAAVRAAATQQAAVLAAPQVILALYHEGPHPIHSRDRAQAVEGHDCKVLQALKQQLEGRDSLATRECVLQLIGQVGCRLASHNAHLLMLAILVLSLDSPEPTLRAAAAEVLTGVAEQRQASLKDLLFANPKLLELVGRNLPSRPNLLPELAELLDLQQRQLAQALLPHALPALVAVDNREGLEALAKLAGLEPRRMLHDYGHYAVAKQLFDGSDSFDGFVAFTEAVTGQDFVVFVRSIMPRTIMEIVMQAGSASEWGSGVPVPEGILQRAGSMLQELSSIACEGKEGVTVAEFLAEGDHVTRTLKEFGDLLEKRHLPTQARPHASPTQAASAVAVLRCVALLIQLTGPFIGRFLPQLMVLLTSALRPLNPREVKLQGLEGWSMLVQALAAHAPLQLGGVVNQVVVALMECLQEAGPVCAAAARVIEELVLLCKRHQREKLRGIPPLPHWVQELQRANQILTEERGQLATAEQVELLIQSLGDESLSVRATALQELKSVLSSRRDWVSRMLTGGGGKGDGPQLLSRLMSALLKCCDPERHHVSSQQAQQACAECLGLLGAIDPSRVQLDLQPPAAMCRSDGELVVTLVTKHLVRMLKTASSLQVLDAATFAIQELLKHYGRHRELAELAAQQQSQEAAAAAGGSSAGGGGQRAQRSREGTPAEGNALFSALPKEVQAIVRPYLESKYSVVSSGKRPLGVVFYPNISFRRWLAVWIEQLVGHHASGERLKLFRAAITVFRFDVPSCLFLLPYLVHNVVALGGPEACRGIQQELEAVLRGGASSREGGLCLQAVFSLLDVLHKWGEEAKLASTQQSGAGDPNSDASLSDSWQGVRQLLSDIPKNLLAQAASQCGAHARALQYFETHLRATRGGALNSAALRSAQYTDDEVSFLQEVYGKLEEPDGLEGLVKLRLGGPRPEDQRLAAEKAGSWSEAATLYEQALQHGAGPGGVNNRAHGGAPVPAAGATTLLEGGLSSTQRGYLSCLLHMGHLQGLLTQVEGLAINCDEVAALQLASLGTAAAWRLGKWELLEGYLRVAEEGSPSALDPAEGWEVRLGRLLWAASRKDESALRQELESARSEVMGPFSAAAMESYTRAYPHLVKLHMLQEVADVAGLLHKSVGPNERHRVLRWEERLVVTQSSLATQEPVLALRRQLATLSGSSVEAGQCWLQLARLCRMTGHHDAATTAVLEAQSCQANNAGLERVMLLWERGEQHRAITELQQVQLELQVCPKAQGARVEGRLQAQVVLQLAQWMAATGQGFKDEIKALFERASSYDRGWESVYFRYAVYLDQLMTDARRRQEGSEKDVKMDRLGGKSRIRLGEDTPHLDYLPEVVRLYGTSVLHGHTHIYQALPRLLTLWFEMGSYVQATSKERGALSGHERSVVTQVHNTVSQFAKQGIPVHLWLTALPQLISRVCHANKDVSDLTKAIICKILDAYPQQCLWALAALGKSTMQNRRAAFGAIQGHAKRHASERNKTLLQEHAGFWEQLIKLCHHSPPKQNKTFSVRREFSHLWRILPLNVLMPVMSALTVALPPGGQAPKDWRYFDDEVTISAMEEQVELLNSLQRPKKVKFLGSDGRVYCFLAKPKDDLRKDNRMMEAAGILNRLFVEDPGARRRNLYLRRFAVIPLTEEAGLVEWVPNTNGLRHCLQDVYLAEGFFDRTSHATIRKLYDTFQGKKRAELLDQVLAMFPPRFHKWQLAKFPEPAAWLNARLAFTRTAAVWSMVGHIVGLGDRHGENILIDQSNGDVVQVDFSCLFDKGLTLEKPEMVPFRLTQNMIDGFGVAGHEGVYRRVCETTLKVLRAHTDTIVSVMDTFVHDPLVEWSRGGGQRGDAEAENPMARDAMATIEGRLAGTLLGVSSQPCLPLSVEGHAHRLIGEATDKENLGQMYIWWMPWW